MACRVGFFTVLRKDPKHYELAETMVKSVRQHMPGTPIVHFTDETSPGVRGVDEVLRRANGKMLEVRLQHYADCQGDWLLLDTDTKLYGDPSNVFELPFDVALSDRNWPHLPQSFEVMLTMPYNSGVVFSRNQQFWSDVLSVWQKNAENDWLSEQRAVWTVVRSGLHHVRVLNGAVYNYPPRVKDDPCTGVVIAHYKGNRKAWMR